ncbi:PREDICTED: protein FAR1-RELATED SEQUENCE 3-like isoform X2 [Ipomoea nil]|nr:PREDICTED: protein FAR1-RELATED SEQUENCE 3-like isoform X2 [Ipomoea nil]
MDGEVIGVKGNQRPKDGEANIERKKDGKRNRETHAEHKDGKQNLLGYSTEEESSNEVEKPFVGMVFESEEAARKYYDAYARHGGFSTHVGQYSRAKPDGPIVSWDFSCSREVFKRKNVESCNAMIRIERKNTENWIVTKFVEDHNHSIVGPSKVHYLRPRRHFAGASKNVVEIPDSQADAMVSMDGNHVSCNTNQGVHNAVSTKGVPIAMATNQCTQIAANTNQVLQNAFSLEANHITRTISPVTPVNFIQPCSRRRALGRYAQNLLDYFKKMQAENPGFYYAIQLDEDNRMTNVFWADARSRVAYSHFGDAVIFDTMYRPNQFQVPIAPFTGVNHHGQMVSFGCALLFDESESSFTWLFQTWLSAMNNCAPVSITTDQDRAIKAAINQVLPGTRHCICKWHILREGQERLTHVYMAYPSFHGELYSCINYSETIEDFESSWTSLLDKFDVHNNEWLQAVYIARQQWSPVYFRDTFFAVLSSKHGVSSFFDGYVNQQTALPDFFKQYERALENSLEREIEADFDTICTAPMLKTPSPMEQQAANLYTRKVFTKFQEELVETFVYTANKIDGDEVLSKFRVAKYEHDDKAFIVELNFAETKASCSCQMFEYSGILCRHILTVFTVTNVLTVPSHYILKRWTRNAKSVLGSDEQDAVARAIDSLASRFNNLCQDALKYAEEGAVAVETYDAASSALREGSRKIAIMKKHVAKVRPPTALASGNPNDDSNKKTPSTTSDTGWPWQDVMPYHINLNDVGVPVGDLDQPTMTPVAINRDASFADNTVVYTCFKSMTWMIESKNPANKVAVINLKLQDYGKSPAGETEVQFRLTRVTLEPMLKSMAYISQQLSMPANRVAVINLKLQDTKTTSGETEVKFQVSRDALGSMLRSMAYIHEQL